MPSTAHGAVDASPRPPLTAPQEPIPDRRFEIADDDGVIRVVLGLLDAGTDSSSGVYGLSLRGPSGAERVALSVDDGGPTLVFVRGGNIAIQIGVDDPLLPGDHAGAFVTLADGQGVPLLYLSAEEDGSLRIRTASDRPSGGT